MGDRSDIVLVLSGKGAISRVEFESSGVAVEWARRSVTNALSRHHHFCLRYDIGNDRRTSSNTIQKTDDIAHRQEI